MLMDAQVHADLNCKWGMDLEDPILQSMFIMCMAVQMLFML